MSTSSSTKRVTETLHEKIADGHYKIGCLIVSQIFNKKTPTKQNKTKRGN